MKKALAGCILCRDCGKKAPPRAIGILTSKDMTILGHSGCLLDNDTRLVLADRKCLNYKEANK